MRARSIVVAVGAVGMLAAGARGAGAATATPASIEGKWLGLTGPDEDRIETGFEFRRDATGAIKAYLYRAVMNTYGAELPGAVERQGEHWKLESIHATLAVVAGELTLTRSEPAVVYHLHRVDTLPSEGPVPAFPAGPGPKWQTKLGGAIYAPVTARDGVVYVGTIGGVMNALDLADGHFLWGFEAGRPIHGGALATDDALYFVCDNGYLFKLERATGKELWRYDLGDERVPRNTQIVDVYGYDGRAPRPVLADGRILVGAADGGFHAIDAATGARVWRFAAEGKIRADALVDGAGVVFGTWGGTLYALDRASGAPLWSQKLANEITSAAARVGDLLVVGSRGSLLYGLKPANGETVWTRTFYGSWVESTPVPYAGTVYIGSSDLRRASAIDPEKGRILWRTDVYGSPWGKPVVTEKYVYVSAEGNAPYPVRMLGSLTALDRQSGQIVWRWAAPELPGVVQNGFFAGPELAGGLLIVGGMDGTVYAFPAP